MSIRLNKYLADRGVASRRKCDEYITQGLVKVNGEVITQLGTKVDPEHDEVSWAGKIAAEQQKHVYYMLNKPVGYVCSVTGPEKPKVVELFSHLPYRLFPVGRLDKLTGGLLLMTTDGQFAYRLTHPKFEKEKEYVVKVREKITSSILAKLRERFSIHGKLTLSPAITLQSPHLIRVILHEGRNRQIRRMCERARVHIEKLKRIRIGKLLLGTLEPGEFRSLTENERREVIRACAHRP